MKVIELYSENFKRLNAKVKMDGKNVTVEGKNGVGKSSFIDAIWIALTGKDIPAEPIQTGKDQAKISVTVKSDDGADFIVERSFTQKGTSLIVYTEAGAKYSSPQRFLDEKIGRISFDPFDFVNKQPREQKKFLMDLLKLNFDDIDSEKKEMLCKREVLAQEYKILIKRISEIEETPEQLELKDVSQVIGKYKKISEERDNIRESERIYNSINSKQEFIVSEIENYKQELKAIQYKIDQHIIELEKTKSLKLEKFGESPTFELPEINDVQAEIQEIDEHNEKVKQQKARKEFEEKLKQVESEGFKLKASLDLLEKQRIKRIAEAKMPINNLSFSEDGVLFDGLPFTEEQLSHAKLIEIGIQIQMSLNPALRIMRVKDGSLLDSETMKSIKNLAKENDYQLFIEKVNDNNEIGFIIEEG